MKKQLLHIMLIGIIVFADTGVFAFDHPGATWLEIGPGGRAAGLAEAMTAVVDGPLSTYWNPALVGNTRGGIEVMHGEWIAGTKAQYIASDAKFGKWGVGVSALHVGTGDLELRASPTSAPIGQFEARSYGAGVSVSRSLPLEGLRVGFTGRFLSDEIYVYSGDGWSADAGLSYSGLLSNHLDLGATIRHMGKMEALNKEAYDLPTTTSLGARWRFSPMGYVQPDLIVDVAKVSNYDISVRAASEIHLMDMFAIRGGYATGYEAKGLALGFGLFWKNWAFDYGYDLFSNSLGYAQRISIRKSWK
ncbi:MAG: PorV/PorQ family protein [Candidatus Electryonea clarkiae]|nr:PorV/PorQ family protein [Candidatus Electryonea clarkiae]MDP8288586.1 PorV/PorQ family protein [Candidatus Electryonea clarkiae]